MTDNPYSPPDATTETSDAKRFRLAVVMAWLSGLVGVAMLGMAVSSIAGSLSSASLAKGQISIYILTASALVALCGLISFFSALCWFKKRSRLATCSFIGSLGLSFLGPRLLAMVVPL
ncbi:hypothetical protein SH528x_006010 [Novipirellula sp. SH528]|uniref:hypothetical protein n=1 Tax=Novipirellula sp. SH528 TaxID=3454466 RepID=UPI003FA0D79A